MQPHSILIVDNDPDGCNAYRELLELDDYCVHTAASCDAALRVVLAYAPELILIDGDPEGIHPAVLGARIFAETERCGVRMPTLVAVRGDLVPGEEPSLTRFRAVLSKPLNFDVLDTMLRQSVSDWLLRSQ